MEHHYSAFISYRHAPQDIAVAKRIQHQLEHFHVPGQIRKMTGKKEIGRIFRDKEELPITSDLNQDISEALNHSDYLIVICSESTRESTWVEREIEYFLHNHSKKQVLTVLVSGEPCDVIPEILLRDTIIKTTSDGTEYEDTVQYEPLSCDYRGSKRIADKEELPRLAAAILGCRYDDLMRRQRQYVIRRVSVIAGGVFILMAMASAYLIWSRAQIRNNLNQALISQSNYLSSEAKKALDDGNRMLAIKLAMAALPSEGNERPLTERAQVILADALNAYGTDKSYKIMATAEYKTEGEVSSFAVNESGEFLVAIDKQGNGYIWNLKEKSLVCTLSSQYKTLEQKAQDEEDKRPVIGRVKQFFIKGSDSIIFLTDRGIQAVRLIDGSEIWKYVDSHVIWENSKICTQDMSEVVLCALKADGRGIYKNWIVCLNQNNGMIINTSEMLEERTEQTLVRTVESSPDGTIILASIGDYSDYSNCDDRIYAWNKANDGIYQIEQATNGFVSETRFIENRKALVKKYHGERQETEDWGIGKEIRKNEIEVCCIDLNEMQTIWATPAFVSGINKIASIESLQHYSGEENNQETSGFSICLDSTSAIVFNDSDGSVLDQIEYTAKIIGTVSLGDEGFYIVLSDGTYATWDRYIRGFAFETKLIPFEAEKVQDFFSDDIRNVAVQTGTDSIRICEPIFNWDYTFYNAETINGDFYISGSEIVGNTLIVSAKDSETSGDKKSLLFFMDLDNSGDCGQLLSEEGEPAFRMIGIDTDRKAIWVEAEETGSVDSRIMRLFLEDGSVEDYTIPKAYHIFAKGNQITSVRNDMVEMYRIENGAVIEERTVSIKDLKKPTLYGQQFFLNETGTKMIGIIENTEDNDKYVVAYKDTMKNATLELRVELSDMVSKAVWDETEARCAVTDGEKVVLLDQEMNVIKYIYNISECIVNMTFFQDQLIVLFSGGYLNRYSSYTGELIGRTRISYFENESFNEAVSWDFYEKMLVISRGEPLKALHFINLASWEEETCAGESLGYDAIHDRILYNTTVPKTGEIIIGYFNRYSAEELIKKGEEVLQGNGLTDEEKHYYGLA